MFTRTGHKRRNLPWLALHIPRTILRRIFCCHVTTFYHSRIFIFPAVKRELETNYQCLSFAQTPSKSNPALLAYHPLWKFTTFLTIENNIPNIYSDPSNTANLQRNSCFGCDLASNLQRKSWIAFFRLTKIQSTIKLLRFGNVHQVKMFIVSSDRSSYSDGDLL